jgi:hypothetical protein
LLHFAALQPADFPAAACRPTHYSPQTGEPSLEEATAFAKAIHEKFPGKLLAYNCSPSFNWKKKLDDATIAKFQATLGALGYKFQVGGGLGLGHWQRGALVGRSCLLAVCLQCVTRVQPWHAFLVHVMLAVPAAGSSQGQPLLHT